MILLPRLLAALALLAPLAAPVAAQTLRPEARPEASPELRSNASAPTRPELRPLWLLQDQGAAAAQTAAESLPEGEMAAAATAPDGVVPETSVPETLVAETLVPETLVPETLVPETLVAETLVAETLVAETLVPETLVLDSLVAETLGPETLVAEAPALDALPPLAGTLALGPAPQRPMARPEAAAILPAAAVAPGRPQTRPQPLELGPGDTLDIIGAQAAPFRPSLRPIWVLAEHGGALTPQAALRVLPQTAIAAVPGTVVGMVPGSGPTELALSSRGVLLPPPRLARSERLLGEGMSTPVQMPLVVPWRPGSRHETRPETLSETRPGMLVPVLLIQPLAQAPARPALRPDGLAAEEIEMLAQVAFVAAVPPPLPQISALAVPRALRPELRPRVVSMREEIAPQVAPEPARSTGPGLCGDTRLQGEAVGNVAGAGACGIENAVRVRSVGAVRLTDSAVVDCTTARALADWVEDDARGIVGGTGGGLAAIQIMGTYACRGRNNQAGARLSEHAFGRAIDIGGFILADGSRVSVLNHWGGGTYGRVLRELHASACGTFGTVLGPEANRYHQDHFHFDTASGRGAWCR